MRTTIANRVAAFLFLVSHQIDNLVEARPDFRNMSPVGAAVGCTQLGSDTMLWPASGKPRPKYLRFQKTGTALRIAVPSE
jgi:hypothetical protein